MSRYHETPKFYRVRVTPVSGHPVFIYYRKDEFHEVAAALGWACDLKPWNLVPVPELGTRLALFEVVMGLLTPERICH